jgi:hypothetical protein
MQRKFFQKINKESKDFYDKCENSVVINGKKSEMFRMFGGVRQESAASAMLFNMELDEKIKVGLWNY